VHNGDAAGGPMRRLGRAGVMKRDPTEATPSLPGMGKGSVVLPPGGGGPESASALPFLAASSPRRRWKPKGVRGTSPAALPWESSYQARVREEGEFERTGRIADGSPDGSRLWSARTPVHSRCARCPPDDDPPGGGWGRRRDGIADPDRKTCCGGCLLAKMSNEQLSLGEFLEEKRVNDHASSCPLKSRDK